MNVFKTFSMRWWQTSLFKLGMLSFGIVVGAYGHSIFDGYLPSLIVVAVISLAYISYVWWKQ